MLQKLTKKQVHSLLSFLETLAHLEFSPGYTVIWTLRSRTILDLHWNITRKDPRSKYGVTLREHLGSAHKWVLDVSEDDL